MMKKLFLLSCSTLISLVILSQSESVCKDSRDGEKYNTNIINGKLWFVDNLNYETKNGSWCYENSEKACEKYGRLYNFQSATEACPDGWRLPTKDEYSMLLKTSGKKPAKTYPRLQIGGDVGFNAKAGGFRKSNGTFYSQGSDVGYWSATKGKKESAWVLYFDKAKKTTSLQSVNIYERAFAVRCVKMD